MVFVALGCFTFCLMLVYIFLQWAGITDPMSGLKAGVLIEFLYEAGKKFFMYTNLTPNHQNMITDMILNAVMGGIAGALIAFVIDKLQ